jgi:hypothetical protein
MVQPEDILKKAHRIYAEYLRACLGGDGAFFPRMVPAQKHPGDDLPSAIQMVQRLREGSKEVVGYGYTVEWREIRSQKLGRNLFPQRISFASHDDLVRFVGKQREFLAFKGAVDRLRKEFPELQRWIKSNVASLIAAAGDLDGLLDVLRYFRNHPRPDCFARELPLAIDTKFVERHEALLRQWLDLVLPPHVIRADEEHFARRYGLRYVEPQFCIRFLDRELQGRLGFPCSVLSLPLHTVSHWSTDNLRLLVVENLVNLMTLPAIPHTVALGGMGNGITLLQHLPWAARTPIAYWGDLDVEGLEILSRLRALFPNTRSIMMNRAALAHWEPLVGKGTSRAPSMPANLTPDEQAAFTICARDNARLEQERIPQSYVAQTFSEFQW